jgi:hypothetical protein
MSIDAMKQALEALEYIENNYMSLPAPAIKAIAALRLAIEQTERQPLTDEEIERATGSDRNKPLWIAIESVARAIERAHGIGGKQ